MGQRAECVGVRHLDGYRNDCNSGDPSVDLNAVAVSVSERKDAAGTAYENSVEAIEAEYGDLGTLKAAVTAKKNARCAEIAERYKPKPNASEETARNLSRNELTEKEHVYYDSTVAKSIITEQYEVLMAGALHARDTKLHGLDVELANAAQCGKCRITTQGVKASSY